MQLIDHSIFVPLRILAEAGRGPGNIMLCDLGVQGIGHKRWFSCFRACNGSGILAYTPDGKRQLLRIQPYMLASAVPDEVVAAHQFFDLYFGIVCQTETP